MTTEQANTIAKENGDAAQAEQAATAGFTDPAAWAALTNAKSLQDFAAAWLDLQCRMVGDVECAVVVLRNQSGDGYQPCCWWPQGSGECASLSATAELALTQSRGVVRQSVQDAVGQSGNTRATDVFGWPLLFDDEVHGVVAIEVMHQDESRMRLVMRLLQWSAAWWQPKLAPLSPRAEADLIRVLGVLATTLDEVRLEPAATAMVTELAVALQCDRVAFGMRVGRKTRIRALSHSAEFNQKSSLIRDLAAAMDEAIDQQATIVLPEPETGSILANHAHRQFAEQHGAGALCSVALSNAGRMIGALTLERSANQPFDTDELALCHHAGILLGPVLEAKRREDRWIALKIWDSLVVLIGHLLGRGHLSLKLAFLAAAGLSAFFILATGVWRVSAPAVLEGTVQRALTAPLDGYIESASVRPGDLLTAGTVMARLEDKDLLLEQAKWDAETEKLAREYSQALAQRDRARVRILGAQIEQAKARSALLAEQLARTRLQAPFDGVVVSGDLSQSIGAPVSRGDLLFEVAPLDSYRVILKVDERDIAAVEPGQRGRIALAGLPRQPLPVAVTKITPVAVAEEGRNQFRVEAGLDAPPAATLELLRPGMQGIGKIDIGERNLFWIWTHRLGHWLRLWWWSWFG